MKSTLLSVGLLLLIALPESLYAASPPVSVSERNHRMSIDFRKDGSTGTPANVDEIWSGFFSRLAEAINHE